MSTLAAAYRTLLDKLRDTFPQPVSDRQHDAYFVFSIMRALDEVDKLKSAIPLLGHARELDYVSARKERLAEGMVELENVSEQLVGQLEGMPIWGHPNTQINVVGPPSIASIIGALLPSIYNPNLVSDDTSYGLAVAECAVSAMIADLVGYDPAHAAGFFTFGGTGTMMYGVKLGLEKACPDTMEHGVPGDVVLLASGQSHYCRLNVAGWLGLGERNVVEVPTHLDNAMRIDLLERALHFQLRAGKRIAAIVATMGSTEAMGIDDLGAIAALRDRMVVDYQLDYRPHIHADAVIGWAWAAFNDYDMQSNDLGFRPRTVRALADVRRRMAELHLADSIGVDFHKTGFCPYISSLCLVRSQDDLRLLARERERMPYLFQSGVYHPGVFTLETSRSGAGVLAALANLRLFGKTGLRCLLGHLVEMAELLRERLEDLACTTVQNDQNGGAVTLFRVYPDGVDTRSITEEEMNNPAARDQLLAHNDYNRRIMDQLHAEAMQGKGVLISMTACYRHTDYGEPIVALKSYMLSPFIDEEHIENLIAAILRARHLAGSNVGSNAGSGL
jgi:L-2,4-diaminobutyrate decarboxylase